jgi:perosamine synthetase
VAHPVLDGNEREYVLACLDSGWISSAGEFVNRFEQAFAQFCGARHAVACSSGTSALHLALLALGVSSTDEILLPTLTYVATANAISYCRARPVLVDSDRRTMNIDPTKIESMITPRTRGIIAVHLYGHPAHMGAILEIAQRHGLFVIEDAAEAHGALYDGKTVGGLGDIGIFSFFGNKIITTGEGGMTVTDNDELADRMRLLRGQGMQADRRYWFPVIGYNYRMTNIAAAIGLAQLERVSFHMKRRREIAFGYKRRLERLQSYLSLPVEEHWARHAFWLYTVTLDDSVGLSRDELISMLLRDGIETRPVFYPMHVLPPYRIEGHLYPIADHLASRGISLPSHGVLCDDDMDYIATRLERAILGSLERRTTAQVRG